ncbi:MAG: hypothetical protein AAB724_00655, partial [Patescibacteria group bacterium]
ASISGNFGIVSFLAKASGNGTIALSNNSFALDANSQNVLSGALVQTTVTIPPVVPPPVEPPPVIPPPVEPPPVVPPPDEPPPPEVPPWEVPPPVIPPPVVPASTEQSSQANATPSSESSGQSFSVSADTAFLPSVIFEAIPANITEPLALFTVNLANDVQVITEQTIEQVLVFSEPMIETAIKVKEISDNPEVEKVTKQVIAPTTVGVSFVAIAPSFANVALPLSRFLFLQPLLILGKRKRKNWGKVYDSLNKLPIGLAILRLIDAKTNKLVQTRVTDQDGHYGFFVVKPGEYRIEVVKNDFVFPSKFLANENVDGRMLDIYHGQNIIMDKENVNIVVNIPIDPIEQAKTPASFILKKNILIAQNIFSMCGTLLMFVYLLISNTWYIWLFLILHISIYLLFLKFIAPKKLKGWGTVYDLNDKNPLYKTVVRLFAKKDSKLISFNVTDKKGRYAFLVGPSNYFVTFEKEGYAGNQGKELNLTDIKEEKILIKEDVGLSKAY